MDPHSSGVWRSTDSSNAGLHVLPHQDAGGSSCSTDLLSRAGEGNRFVFPY